MPLTLQQTDTDLQGASECGVITACATGTIAADTIESRLLEGGTAGSVEQTVAIPASSSRLAVFLQSGNGVPGVATWDAGDWIVRFNVTTAQMDTVLDAIYICRIDNTCGTVATIVSETGIGASIAGGGVFTRTLNAAEHTGTDTDEIYIVVRLSNAHTMTSRTVGITPDQIIDTPIAEVLSADLAATLPALTGSFDAGAVVQGDLSATLPLLTTTMNVADPAALTDENDVVLRDESDGVLYDETKTESTPTADLSATLPALTGTFDVDVTVAADLAGTLPGLTAAFDAGVLVSGDLSATLPALTGAFDAGVIVTADLAATLPSLTAAFDVAPVVTADLATSLPSITGTFDADVTVAGDLSATLPGLTATFDVDVAVQADLAASLPLVTASFGVSASDTRTLDLAATLPALTANFDTVALVGADLAATLPGLTGTFDADVLVQGDLSATLPVLSASFNAGALIQTDLVATLPMLTGSFNAVGPDAGGFDPSIFVRRRRGWSHWRRF